MRYITVTVATAALALGALFAPNAAHCQSEYGHDVGTPVSTSYFCG